MECRSMEMAALGRPLYPGMLYDCCSDSFIPGVTLWNKQTIMSNLDVHPQPKTDLKFSSSDALSEKARLLDISGSLKVSFLCGLVNVSGSAKYMNDTKSSEHQCQVTLQYSQTTKFEQMTMAELGNIIYPQVFEQQTATHVITAVQYGAQAFMVFDYTTSNDEKKTEINGKVELLVKKIPILSGEGEVNLNLNDNEKVVATNMSVTFYGDYELDENPTNFTEALQTYKKLPSLLRKKGSDGVPQRVWLYPLKFLDSKAAQLVREISESLISKAELSLEELRLVERRCNDLLKNKMVDDFSALKERLQMFKTLQNNYKSELLKKLSSVLPDIRGGTQKEERLHEILITHDKSPFTATSMNKWLDDLSTEVDILSFYVSELKDIRVMRGPIDSLLHNPHVDLVVCLSFTSLSSTDLYLKDLVSYLKNQNTTEAYTLQPVQHWFAPADVSSRMRQNLALFTSFSAANKNNERICFIIASIPDPDNPGISIKLYEKGCLTDPKFIPVSKPPPPTAKTSGVNISLQLQKPPTGKTLRFRVEYKKVNEDKDQEEPWEIIETPDERSDFTLTELQYGSEYLIRYKAISAAGLSEASDSVCVQLTKDPESRMNDKKIEGEVKDFAKLTVSSLMVRPLKLYDTGRGNFRKKEYGTPSNLNQRNKTIMLLGATGSGKSTLINGMINYIMGVEWNDKCRFKLIDEQNNRTQAESQTSEVTAYQIHHDEKFKVPYSLTIIDTPGFGDTSGITRDKQITEKIRQFFSEQNGVLGLDAVCFVVQAALARLTPTQKYIFETVLSIFGKDIANNITIMITFADGQKPPVLDAIKAADIPCTRKKDGSVLHFKFNNSSLFAEKLPELDDDYNDNFDEMFWKMGQSCMKRFFTHLETMETKSLQLTKEVLSERKQLDPLSTPDYIDLLIESEKQSGKPGFKKRIAELEELKQRALILQKVEKREPLTQKKLIFNNAKDWLMQK